MPLYSSTDIAAMNFDPLIKSLFMSLMGVKDGVTATAGGTQAGLLVGDAVTRVTTVATAGDSVRLPDAAPGLHLTIINAAAANSMNVFPAVGDAINAVAADGAYALAANKQAVFTATSFDRWHAVVSA